MKINIKKIDAVEKALKKVNKDAAAHTFTSASEIHDAAHRAENALESMGLPIAMRSGALYNAVSGDAVPNSYRYSRQATEVRLERGGKDWFLVSVDTSTIWSEGGKSELRLTPAQDAEAVARLRAKYRVIAS